ncbi:hypothetical protein ABH924_003780 [Arthrobacter sp. GAS37]|uniref:hypothetical protein n=1 Tax=Arthrobacter sp. GAS37 TaxID=3156261 RepID=UPI003834D5CF
MTNDQKDPDRMEGSDELELPPTMSFYSKPSQQTMLIGGRDDTSADAPIVSFQPIATSIAPGFIKATQPSARAQPRQGQGSPRAANPNTLKKARGRAPVMRALARVLVITGWVSPGAWVAGVLATSVTGRNPFTAVFGGAHDAVTALLGANWVAGALVVVAGFVLLRRAWSRALVWSMTAACVSTCVPVIAVMPTFHGFP